MEYYQNLQKVCKEKNTSPTAVLKQLGLSTSLANGWKKGGVPKLDTACLISDFLQVPLIRFIDSDWVEPKANPEHNELITCFDSLDRSGQVQLLGKAYELKEQNTKKGSNSGNSNPVAVPVSTISSSVE